MAFDLALNAAKGAGFQIQAGKIGGNLLSGIKLEDARVSSAFVNGTAKVARVKYPLWQLLTKRDLRLDVALEGATVDFDPLKLPPVDANAPAPPVNVSLERASVQDVRVKLRGKFIEIPNVTARILEQHDTSETNFSGSLKLALETVTGAGTATVDYQVSKDWVLKLQADADLDARIARYWYKDIKSGRVLAHYSLDGDKLTGSGEIKDGVLEPIPGIVVSNLRGPVTHDANGLISGHLKAVALEGPLELNVNINTVLKKENISVSGWAEPKLQPALTAFKTGLPGSGKVRVTVSGGGWQKLEFKGKIAGKGRVLEFPLENVAGDWAFNSPGDTLTANILTNSRFLDAPVKAKAKLDFKLLENLAVVNAGVNGEQVLGAPLEATGQLTAKGENLVYAFNTKILNGQAKATGELLAGKTILGSGDFTKLRVSIPFENLISGSFKLGGINSDIRITGDTTQNSIKIPGVKPSSFPGEFALRIKDGTFSGSAQLGEFAWNGDLERGEVSLKNLQLQPAGVVTANASYKLQGPNGVLTGKLKATDLSYQGATFEDANGPFSLEVGKRLNGYWSADKLEGFLQGDRVRIKPRGWLVRYSGQRVRLSGDATYLFNGNLAGSLNASTDYGVIRAMGQGKNIALDGNLRYSPLPGKTLAALAKGTLQLEPFKLQTTASISSNPNVFKGNVFANLGSSLAAGGTILTTGGRKLELKFENGVLNSNGEVNLSAVDAVLPKSVQGQISGVAKLEFVNTNGTAKLTARAFGVPILADLEIKNNRVSTNAKATDSLLRGLTAKGQVFPKINALLTYGSIRASVSGKTDNLKFSAFGRLPSKPQLEQLGLGGGIKKLGLDWNPETIALKGSFKQNVVTARGTIGKIEIKSGQYNLATQALNANWRGSFATRYQNKPITISNSLGQVVSTKTGLNLSVSADKLEGEFQNQRVKAVDLTAKASITSGLTNFDVTAQSVDAKLQGQVLKAQNLDARGTLTTKAGINLNLKANQIDANLQGQKLIASNLMARAVISSDQKFDVKLKATTLDADFRGQRLKASNLSAFAVSDGQLRGNLEAESLVGKLSGTAFDVQGINASAQPMGGKLEVVAKVKSGNATVQNNPFSVTNLELTGSLNTTNLNKLASANFQANLSTSNLNGKLAGITVNTQDLNADLVRTGSSITGDLKTGIASASDKDWQLDSQALQISKLNIGFGNALEFSGDLQISSAVGAYQKNPFKLEQTTVSLRSNGKKMGFALDTAALEGNFEGYQLEALQVVSNGQFQNNQLQLNAALERGNAARGTDQLGVSKLELNGQYDLKTGNASVARFQTTDLDGKLKGDTVQAQALEGSAELINAASGQLQDAILRGSVSGGRANGIFEDQAFNLEHFKANLSKRAANYQATLEASQAMGGWQEIRANLEQLKVNAKLENQRLSADGTGAGASGQYQDATANLAKFKFSGAMNGSRLSGQLETSQATGAWQDTTANLSGLTVQARSSDGVLQAQLEAATASGTYNDASAKLEHFKLNAKQQNNTITGDLTATRATGVFQNAGGKLEQFKVNGRLENHSFTGDLRAVKGSGNYQAGNGTLENLTLSASLNGNVVTGELEAQHANGAWKDINAKLEQIQFAGSLIDDQFKAELTAASGLGKTKDANLKLEQLQLEGRMVKDQIYGTLAATRGTGAYQKAKADLSQFKANGSLIDGLFKADLEAQQGQGSYLDGQAKLEQFKLNAQAKDGQITANLLGARGSGSYRDASAKLEQISANAEMVGTELRGTLEAASGDGEWQDASAKLRQFRLNAETTGQSIRAKLEAQQGSGLWKDAKLELQDFNALGTLQDKNINGQLAAKLGSGRWNGVDIKLEQFNASADVIGQRVSGTLKAIHGQAVRKGSSVNLVSLNGTGELEGNRLSVKLDADHGDAQSDDINAFLKEFNRWHRLKPQNEISRHQKKTALLLAKQNPDRTPANLKLEQFQASLEMQGKILGGRLQASSGAGALAGNALTAQGFLATAKLNGSKLDSSFTGDLGGMIEGQLFNSKLNARLGLDLDQVMDLAWRGEIEASANGRSPKSQNWKLEANGPWSALNLSGTAPSAFLAGFANTSLPKQLETLVKVNGLVNLPKLEFNAGVSANLGTDANAIGVDSRVQRKSAKLERQREFARRAGWHGKSSS